MDGINDLFGDISLSVEEPQVIELEEVSSTTTGEGEDSKGGDVIDKGKGTKTTSKDVEVSDLETELIDVKEASIETTEETTTEEKSPSSKDKDKSSNSSSSPEIKPFAELSKMFFEEGVISQEIDEEGFNKLVEEEGGDPLKAVSTLIARTVDDVHQSWIDTYPPVIQDMLKSYHANLPLEKIFSLKSNQIQLEGISEEKLTNEDNVDLRKQILTEHLKATTKFSEDKIRKTVDNTVQLGEDIEEAKTALKELKGFRKEEEENIKKEAVRQQEVLKKTKAERFESIKRDVYSTKQIIPGIELQKTEQDALAKSMTSIVYVDDNGMGMTDVDYMFAQNPMEMRKALHYYTLKGMFKINPKTKAWEPDFSKITNSIKTNLTKEEKNKAANSRGFRSGDTTIEDTPGKVDLSNSISSWLKNKQGT
jgi:hypothetical protein